jgi:hypothetical protein
MRDIAALSEKEGFSDSYLDFICINFTLIM